MGMQSKWPLTGCNHNRKNKCKVLLKTVQVPFAILGLKADAREGRWAKRGLDLRGRRRRKEERGTQ